MVSHCIGDILNGKRMRRLDVQRHLVGRILSGSVVNVERSVLVSDFSAAQDVEEAPYPGLAAPQGAE